MAILQHDTVLVADDHSLYRTGLSFSAERQTGLLRRSSRRRPSTLRWTGLSEPGKIELALFDLAMPGISGPESLNVVKEIYPGLRVAIVSGSEERDDVSEGCGDGI